MAGKENQITFNLDSDLLKEFKSIVEKENTTMDRALSVVVKRFIKNGDSINEFESSNNFISDEEQAELENDKEFVEMMNTALNEKGGRLVN